MVQKNNVHKSSEAHVAKMVTIIESDGRVYGQSLYYRNFSRLFFFFTVKVGEGIKEWRKY